MAARIGGGVRAPIQIGSEGERRGVGSGGDGVDGLGFSPWWGGGGMKGRGWAGRVRQVGRPAGRLGLPSG